MTIPLHLPFPSVLLGLIVRWKQLPSPKTASSIELQWDDVLSLLLLGILSLAFVPQLTPWRKAENGHHLFFVSPQKEDGLVVDEVDTKHLVTRNIDTRLKQLGKEIVIFWGSQSGTSMRLAKFLARECQTRYGILATAEDLDMYDHQHLSALTSKKIVGFIVSTFGEGDPSDNAVGLYDYLTNLRDASNAVPGPELLPNLRYFAFGLGSSKYQHYNRFVDVVDQTLTSAGAQRLGFIGKADETLRSDHNWRVWKEDILTHLGTSLNRKQIHTHQSAYDTDIELVEVAEKYGNSDTLHTELYKSQSAQARGQIHSTPICDTRELTKGAIQHGGLNGAPSRTYLHIEFGQENARHAFKYENGDHIAVWPVNPYHEVQKLIKLFGWDELKLHAAINIRSIATADGQPTITLPLPTTTTREILLTNCLDICGPVSQESVTLLAHFAPNNSSKRMLESLTNDSGSWASQSASNFWTIGRLMQFASPGVATVWPSELFTLLVQSLPKLQPRYFSIASSPKISPHRIAITVGVVNEQIAGTEERFHGLTTNYLNALHQQPRSENTTRTTANLSSMPVSASNASKVLTHIRTSTFRLPLDICRPIIMVGAGSGIAPFRAFVQERAGLAAEGFTVGSMLLFFGCRSASEDFLYADEWADCKREHRFFDIDCAFSRDGERKVYVQDRLRERGEEVRRLVVEQGAAFYICGSTRMAKGVKGVLVHNLTNFKWDKGEATRYVDQMRKEGLLQEDTWT